jgi:hypothetical protein
MNLILPLALTNSLVNAFDIAVGFSQRMKNSKIKGFSHILSDVAKA